MLAGYLNAHLLTDQARFLLAQLHIDSLRDKTSTKLIKKALEALPKGSNALDGAYRGAMQRVDDQMEGFRILAKQLLGWLTYSERLMTVEEVQHALAIEPGTPDFDEENLGDIDEVVGFCAGLVIVDEETQIIRLVHYTTQEYFRRNGDRILASARQEIAISCLTYLLYDIFGTGWFHEAEEGNNSGGDEWEIGERYGWQSFESVKARAQKYPFLKYASRYWATHARICEQQNVKTLTMSLAKDERRISSASQVMLSVNQDALSYELDITKSRHPLTAMHVIAYLGYPEMIKELLSHGFEVNSKDLAHRTPLWYAAHQGHEAVVELLLSQSHIEVNSKDDPDDTALHVAAALGHEAIVKLLISRTDVEVNSKDQHGRTALHRAALGGHASIVKLLLGCFNIDVNSKDDYGSRPLHKAAKFGHAVVLKLLISHTDLDVNLEDIVGHTALHEAVRCGDASIVELLLGCFNIDVDSKDEYGSTLLHRAAGLGHAAVLKLLISHTNLDVNAENSLGSTALHNAARFGHASIVELLLGCFNIDVNLKDNYGSTPLHEAAKPFIFTVQQDNESLMTMLLGHIAIEVNPKNSLGATPLALAIVYGHVAAIQLLCARPDVDLDPRDDQGRDVYALVKENKSFLSRFEEMLESFGPEEEEKLAEESNGVFKGSPSHDRIQSKLVPKQEECLEILRTAIEARARDRLHRIQVAEGSVDMELIPPISDESL